MELSVIITNIANAMFSQFDFGYMLTINVATYLMIKIWDILNGDKLLNTWQKRMVLLLAIFITTAVYVMAHYPNHIILFNSAIVSPVFWSWVLRPVLTKLGIGYKQVDDVLG